MTQDVSRAVLAVGPEEAGRMTGHSRSAVYEAIARGDLVSFKSGKRRLILIKELESWLNRLAKENAR
ncbi:helix-turn-helix domain-containing protein [Azotobacter armeniacus]